MNQDDLHHQRPNWRFESTQFTDLLICRHRFSLAHPCVVNVTLGMRSAAEFSATSTSATAGFHQVCGQIFAPPVCCGQRPPRLRLPRVAVIAPHDALLRIGFPQSLRHVALSGRARDEVTVRHIGALFSSPNGSVGKALDLSEQPTGVGGTVRTGADDDFIGCNPGWRSFSQV